MLQVICQSVQFAKYAAQFQIADAEFVNSNPNLDSSQSAQHILQIALMYKLHTTKAFGACGGSRYILLVTAL